MAQYFSVIGLLFDIVGAWMIGYEVIFGYIIWNETDTYRKQKENFKRWKKKFIKGVEELPDDLYTKEIKQKEIEDIKERYGKHEKEAMNKEQKAFEQHRTKSFLRAFFGLILLMIGFIFQIIGVIKA